MYRRTMSVFSDGIHVSSNAFHPSATWLTFLEHATRHPIALMQITP